MPTFAVGQSVTVRPDCMMVHTDRVHLTRHHLASASGVIAEGGRPDMGLYLVAFDLGEWGAFTATVDHRDLEG